MNDDNPSEAPLKNVIPPRAKIQFEITPNRLEQWEIVLVTLQNVADTLKQFGKTSLKILEDADAERH